MYNNRVCVNNNKKLIENGVQTLIQNLASLYDFIWLIFIKCNIIKMLLLVECV